MKSRGLFWQILWLLVALIVFIGAEDRKHVDVDVKESESLGGTRKKTTSAEIREIDDYLLQTASRGMIAEVKRALKRGAHINVCDGDETGSSPLMWSAANGHIDVVRLLLLEGADPNLLNRKGDRTALLWAVYHQQRDIIQLLIEKGARVDEPNARGDTALLVAAYQGHHDIVDVLLTHGADMTHVTTNGNEFTALHLASFRGHVNTVEILLERGADAGQRDANGRTPLMLAALQGQEEVLERLRFAPRGADINMCDDDGNHALLLAMRGNQTQMALHLINLKAVNLHRMAEDRQSALTLAVKFGNLPVVRAIYLADTAYVTSAKVMARSLRIARAHNQTTIARFLSQFQEL